MKIRAQIAMVLNLDKCIGCRACSVTCKNVWTNREGMEYAWFNNVETKARHRLSQAMGKPGALERRQGAQGERRGSNREDPRRSGAADGIRRPDLQIDDYYEPFALN